MALVFQARIIKGSANPCWLSVPCEAHMIEKLNYCLEQSLSIEWNAEYLKELFDILLIFFAIPDHFLSNFNRTFLKLMQ